MAHLTRSAARGVLGAVAACAVAACAVAACTPSVRSAPAASPKATLVGREGPLLPARIRRLSNAEIARSIRALLGGDGADDAAGHGSDDALAAALPPDVRQDGYTRNAGQVASTAWLAQLDTIVRAAVHRAVYERGGGLVPCGRDASAACTNAWIDRVGQQAFRRPLEPDERALLRATFARGAAERDGAATGAAAVLRAVLESPSFVYLTELGAAREPGQIGRVVLTPYEVAATLSYTVRGAPPDDALFARAASGAIMSPDVREQEARRLLSESDTRFSFRRFVFEWLEVDDLANTTKDAALYPGYDDTKSHMLAETAAFVDEVMVFGGGSLRGLLRARFASVDPTMARFYGLKTWGTRASLAGTRREGVLQQASFLAAHAHEDSTSPVKRGDFVLRRLLCVRLPRPAEVGIDTVFPPPNPAMTTRERFASHVADPACAGCHRRIDPLGYAFEQFDASGAFRTEDHGRAVDATATVDWNGSRVALQDSLDLSEWLAASPAAQDCYLRQALRYFTAQADPAVEAALLDAVHKGAPGDTGNLFDALVAFVRSDMFVEREVHP